MQSLGRRVDEAGGDQSDGAGERSVSLALIATNISYWKKHLTLYN